jgi:hypothetical protein
MPETVMAAFYLIFTDPGRFAPSCVDFTWFHMAGVAAFGAQKSGGTAISRVAVGQAVFAPRPVAV